MYYHPQIGTDGGRLGNQMFRYAAVHALAIKNNSSFGMPDVDCEIYKAFPDLSVHKASPDEINSATSDYVSKEGYDFNFEPGLFACADNSRIFGYFQSELYFKDFSESVRKEFTFSDAVQKETLDYFNQLKQENNGAPICAVHFRRTDYTQLAHVHTNLTSDYYNPACSWMLNNIQGCKLLAISDDYEWCRENLPADTFIFPDSKGMFHDMKLMSLCDAHIIANSSFSWWGAWLSENSRQVIAPSNWFGPEGPKKWDTIYCNGWGVI